MVDRDKYIDGLVSVIIPTYNSEKYIEKTVETVLAQDYDNYEIILVDDCSKDNTRAVLEKLSSTDDRIRFIFQEKNSGAAKARNAGINVAKGRFIAFLDSDDLWEHDKLTKQLAVLKEGHPFVFCSFDLRDEGGNKVHNKIRIKSKVRYKDLMTHTYISTPATIYDRFFYGDVQMPDRRTGQDYAFWLILLKQSDAYGIDEALVHVTKRGNSLSKSKFQSLRDIYEVQTAFEHISRPKALIHVFAYFFYAIKKYCIGK